MYSGLLPTPLGQETISVYIPERCPHCKGPKMIMVFGDSVLFINSSGCLVKRDSTACVLACHVHV